MNTKSKVKQSIERDSRSCELNRLRRELRRVKEKVAWLKAKIIVFYGRIDGKNGLPRVGSSGIWISPMMAKDQGVAETYCAHKWAELEIFVSAMQEEVNKLNIIIDDLEVSISLKKSEEPSQPTEPQLSVVYDQEINAQPEMIRLRRYNEWKKANAGYYNALAKMVQDFSNYKQSRSELLAAIEEATCLTRMLCEKKKTLHRQRIDLYYHGALKAHPDKTTMPPVAQIMWLNHAEKLYSKQHKIKEEELSEDEVAI